MEWMGCHSLRNWDDTVLCCAVFVWHPIAFLVDTQNWFSLMLNLTNTLAGCVLSAIKQMLFDNVTKDNTSSVLKISSTVLKPENVERWCRLHGNYNFPYSPIRQRQTRIEPLILFRQDKHLSFKFNMMTDTRAPQWFNAYSNSERNPNWLVYQMLSSSIWTDDMVISYNDGVALRTHTTQKSTAETNILLIIRTDSANRTADNFQFNCHKTYIGPIRPEIAGYTTIKHFLSTLPGAWVYR